MEKKQLEKVTETLETLRDELKVLFRGDEKLVRYDFSWQITREDRIQAIVTRKEWRKDSSIMSPPAKVNDLLVELVPGLFSMKPVPPAKTFYRIPDDEQCFFEAVVNAYMAGVKRELDFVCWERVN